MSSFFFAPLNLYLGRWQFRVVYTDNLQKTLNLKFPNNCALFCKIISGLTGLVKHFAIIYTMQLLESLSLKTYSRSANHEISAFYETQRLIIVFKGACN